MPVVNVFHKVPYDQYVGRGSIYGNPFTHHDLWTTRAVIKVRTREEAIDAFRIWLTSDLEVPGWPKPTHEQILELRGKTLGCWCAPQACHGDVLLERAEELARLRHLP